MFGDLGRIWTEAGDSSVRGGPEYSRGTAATKRRTGRGATPAQCAAGQGRKSPEATTDVRARPQPMSTSPG